MEIRELIEKIVKEMVEKGGLKNVVWVAAGGSNDGHYAAQYFMDRESTAVRSQMITSSEFEFAAPKCIGENTIAVITSMRPRGNMAFGAWSMRPRFMPSAITGWSLAGGRRSAM